MTDSRQMALEALQMFVSHLADDDLKFMPETEARGNAAIASIEADMAKGVEPVATVSISHFRGCKSMENVDFQLSVDLPDGTHKLYTAPQEPVNAWIAIGDGLPDIGVPVMAMVGLTTPEMYPMMRGDAGGDEWLWEAHRSGPIDDPRSYEADDDYEVVAWVPLPKKPGATT